MPVPMQRPCQDSNHQSKSLAMSRLRFIRIKTATCQCSAYGNEQFRFWDGKPWWGSSILVRILSNGVHDVQPDEPRYHFLAGKAHRRLKHYSRAIERYRRAVRLRPGYGEAIIELSTLGPLAFVAHHLRGADQDAAA